MKLLTTTLVFCSIFVYCLRDVRCTASEKVNITVFYETLCPASIEFITEQLYPTTKNFSEYFTLDLVPFGNGNLLNLGNHGWFYTCQHGKDECYGNGVHACVIDQITDDSIVVDVLQELMKSNYTDKEVKKTFRKHNLNYEIWKKCMTNNKVFDLLKAFQQKTYDGRITVVPTIFVNNKSNNTVSFGAMVDLSAVVCHSLADPPKLCEEIDIDGVFKMVIEELGKEDSPYRFK